MSVIVVPPVEDKVWLALMESLAALTSLMRFASGENYIDKDGAMGLAADAIRAIVLALDEFNV